MAEAKETKTKKSKSEATYSKREILSASTQFGISADAMAGALRRIEKEHLTRAEVERAIQDFRKRQV